MPDNLNVLQKIQLSLSFVQGHVGSACPELLLVAGSGFTDALPRLEATTTLKFGDIPGFPQTTVEGHLGELIVGNFLDPGSQVARRVAILRGRIHLYEGYTAAEVTHPLRTLLHWGCQRVVLTNAAGSLNPKWRPGSFFLITDHINATGHTPLLGPHRSGLQGPMFLDMTSAYDKAWLEAWRQAAQRLKIQLYEGTYLGVLGPCYETPAEVRAFQKWGGDAVGMSTVLETIAARHLGARVSALSLLTNIAAGLIAHSPLDHQDVLAESRKAQFSFSQLIAEVLPTLLA